MLAFLAIFGALGAGFLADTFMSSRGTDSATDDEAEPDETETENGDDDDTSGHSLLDWAHFGSGQDDAEDEDPPHPSLGRFAASFGWEAGEVDDGMPVSDDIPDPVDTSETLAGGSADDILSGHDADDELIGGDGQDQLTGRSGDDQLFGENGDDILVGEDGDDQLFGGDGNDTAEGGAGDDRLYGEAGADSLAGHAGHDTLDGGDGDDTLHGGEGDDLAFGGTGNDWLTGGSGDDVLSGGAGEDTVDGGIGNDLLSGSNVGQDDLEIDMLNGGQGDDTLSLGAGDWGSGGTGADQFEVTDVTSATGPARITDFSVGEDRLEISFDPDVHPDPVLTVTSPAGSSTVTVLLDGVPLAVLEDALGLTADMISLRPS